MPRKTKPSQIEAVRPAATAAAIQVRRALHLVIDADPENSADALAGAMAEIINRHVAAYGRESTARLCERAAALARTAPGA